MNSVFLLHIPKTGGTSVDAILGESFPAHATLRGLGGTGNLRHWYKIDSDSIQYLSGHIPAAAVDLDRFEHRITIFRSPAECLGSLLRYSKSYFPADTLREQLRASREPFSIYWPYFSPEWDAVRFKTELAYGVNGNIGVYGSDCSVADAASILGRFTRVLDFRNLAAEILRLVIEYKLFPRDTAPHLREVSSPLESPATQNLVSHFDEALYERAKTLFRPVPSDFKSSYDQYRRNYSTANGLNIVSGTSVELDLNAPLGNGWWEPEQSDLGSTFRWAISTRPTLHIPIATAGTYCLRIYLKPMEATSLRATVTSAVNGETRNMEHEPMNGVSVLRASIVAADSDWLDVRFDCNQATADNQIEGNRIFILGNVLVQREAIRRTVISP